MSGDAASVWRRIDAQPVDRRSYLKTVCAGRRVLHLGCVDDRLTALRLGTGELLHEELAQVAMEITGVDLSASGIRFLAEHVPGDYVVGDIEQLDELGLPTVDVVVAAEVIEHLPSPGRFLASLQRHLESHGGTAIITTPNAYSWRHNLRAWTRRAEFVHPDHLLIFSPATLQHSIEQGGLRLDRLLVDRPAESGSWRRRFVRAVDSGIVAVNPLLASGLIAEVSSA